MSKNAIDSGSPPCSPQMPSLRCGFASRPVHAASRTSQPTPGLSIVSNGLRSRILRSMYFARKRPSTSSRENPEPAAARAEHRVDLLERVHALERALEILEVG